MDPDGARMDPDGARIDRGEKDRLIGAGLAEEAVGVALGAERGSISSLLSLGKMGRISISSGKNIYRFSTYFHILLEDVVFNL